jgi:hypothetical protein
MVFLGLALAFQPARPVRAQHYQSPPEILSNSVTRAATAIDAEFAESGKPASAATELEQLWPSLVFYTVADALPGDELHQIRGLHAYRYLGEVTRTDKQTGSTATGPGSTTLSQKPGFAELLAFAVEHGAVEQTTNGTGATLSTSPYALTRLVQPDNAENFDRFGFWRRIGVSATLNASTEGAAAPADEPLKQLAEWSVRLRVLGDRSTRSPGFTRGWEKLIQPAIQERVDAEAKGASETINGSPAVRDAAAAAATRLGSDLQRYLTDHGGLPTAERVPAMAEMILDALHAAVYEPVANRRLAISDSTGRGVVAAVASLAEAHQRLVQAEVDQTRLLEDLDQSLLLTLEYTHHAKAAAVTGFSDMRMLFEDHVAPFNVVANAFLSLYDDPDETLGQDKVRDYGASVDIEGEVANPFGRRSRADVVQPITLSVGYKLSRLEEGEEMVHLVQAKASIPISTGLALPLSLTYASRAVLVDEDHVRGNFGLSLDLDKLYALSKAFAGD